MLQKRKFNKRKIVIRELSKKDLKFPRKFLDFFNSLIEEEVQITSCEKKSLKEEKEWLKKQLEEMKKKRRIVLVVKDQEKVVGICDIGLLKERCSHVGILGITIRRGYRGIGLGSYLMKKTLELAKTKLKPQLKIIRLSVFVTNKRAISFYKKFGFEKVAKVPKQIEYKAKLIDEIIMIRYL